MLKASAAAVGFLFAPQAAQAQQQPAAPTLTLSGTDYNLVMRWRNIDGVTGWEYQYKFGTGNYGDWISVPPFSSVAKDISIDGTHGGLLYTFRLRAVKNGVKGAITEKTATATGTPSPSLTATAGDGRVKLDWTFIMGTRRYDNDGWAYRQKEGTGSYGNYQEIPGDDMVRTHTVTGLTNSTKYTFQVIRRQAEFGGGFSTVYPISFEATATPVAPPAAPTGLAAAAGNGQVVLTWTNPDDATITGYELRHGKTGARGSTSWSAIANSDADTITHTVTGLDNDSEYSFQLRAKNSAGESTATAWVTATPFNPKTITLEVTAIDSSPSTSTSISEGNTGSTTDVTVTIRLGEDPPDDVLITLASDPDKQGTSTGSTKAAASSCTQPLNPMDTDWCFPFGGATVTIREGVTQATKRVRILGDTRDEQNETINLVGSGSGWVSGKLTITITDDDDNRPAAPTNLTASKGDRQVVLSWTKPSGPITSYKLAYAKSTERGSATFAAITGSSASTVRHIVTGLDNDAEYSFKIRAVNASGDGAETGWVTATPVAPVAPVLTAATSPTNQGINLTWTHAGRAASDLVSNAVRFASWQASVRMKGGSQWRPIAAFGSPTTITTRDGNISLGDLFPGGTSVEVRVQALAYNSANTIVNGPWSGIRTVTYRNTATSALAITGAPVSVSAGATATYTVALTKAYGGTLSVTSANMDEATVSPGSLDFTTGDYNLAKTVTVTGVAAGTATINHAFRLTGASADAIPDAGTVAVTVNAASTVPAPVPVKPTGFTATQGSANQQVMLSWSDPNDASITKWQYSQDDTWKDVPSSSATTTTYTVTGLSIGTTYAFKVRAVNGNGDGVASDEASVTVAWQGIPSKPSGLAATAGNGEVTLKWAAQPNQRISAWEYQYKESSSSNWPDDSNSVTGTGATTSRTVSGLTAGTAYDFRIRASQGSGNEGPWSDAVTATPLAESPPSTPGVTVSEESLTVTEAAGASRTATYTVVLNTAPSGTVTVTPTSADPDAVMVSPANLRFTSSDYSTAQTVTVTGVEDADRTNESVMVNHGVMGYGSGATAVTSAASVTVMVTDDDRPAAPTGLTATGGNARVILRWSDPDDASITEYEVQQKKGSDRWSSWSGINNSDASTVSHTVTGLENGSRYGFRIRAVNSNGASPESSEEQATPVASSTPGVTVSEESLTVTEAAGASRTATYTVVLNTAPSGTVTVTPTSADPDAVMVSPANLRFTSSDYSTAQTVTVTGVEDADRTNESVMVNHGVMGYGSGATAVTSAASVTVRVTDDDRPAAPTGLTATGGNARVILRWSDPDDASITEYEVQQKKGSDRWSSWSDINNSDASTISHTVTGLENGSRYGFRIRALNSNGASPESSEEQATPVASSTPGVTVSTSALTVEEGKMGTYTVVLDTAPSAMVTIMVGGASGEVKVTGSPLIFTTTNWDTAQTVTVNAGTDADTTNDTATLTHGSSSSDTNYGSSLDIDDVEVKVIDTTPVGNAGVRVTPTMLRLEEGGRTGTYRVVLGAMPSGNVTVTPSPTGADAAAVSVSGVLIFNASNWDTARMVTVTPVEDDDANDETVTVTNTVRGSGEYARVTAGSVTVAVEDDETAGVTVTPTELSLSEGGPTGSYTVKLNTDPEAAVTVTPVSNDAGAASVSGGPLTFTSSNWDTEQMVMVTPVGDDDANDETVTVSHGISGYSGVSRVDSVTVRVDDDDTAGVTVSTTRLSLTEGGSAGSYTVVLDSNPLATVTVTPASDDAGAAMVSGGPLTFTSSNWSTEQIVMVTPVDDDDANDETVMVSHAISGYGGVSRVDSLTVTVDDDDTAGVTVSTARLALAEGGRAGSYTVKLNSNPLATVTVTPRGGDAGAAMVSGGPLTFNSSNWRTEQVVMVTPVDDDDANDETVTVSHGISGYSGVSRVDSLTVTVDDDETAGVTVSTTRLALAEGGSARSYTVVLDSDPLATVTVTPASDDAGAATVSGGPLTFDSSNWSTAQSVTVTPVDDADANDETVMVGHAIIGYPRISDSDVDEVTVTVADDDTAGVTVTPTSLSLTEGGSTGTYTVKLNTMPSGNVTVTPGSGDTGAVMVSAVLTFTPSNWDTARMVTVTPVGDDDADNETVTVTHAISGYGTVRTADSVMVMVTDDETEDRPQVEARKQELVGLSRATLGMATDMIGARVGGDLSGSSAGAGAIGEQALGVMGNLLGFSHGSELSTNLSLEQLGEQLWNQSFHISQSDSERAIGEQRGRWSLWGAGELRSFKGDDTSDAEDHSYSGSIKAGWLGVDYQFSNAWLAGLAVSFSSVESDYTYRSQDGTGAGKTETQLTTFYPYGSLQLTERLKLWGTAGIGFGDLRHQSNDDDSQQDGELKVHLAAIGFEQKLSSLAAWNLFSLAGDLAFVQSSTEWQDGALTDQSVSITRARLGVNSSFPLSQTTTGYMNLRGRLDGGDLQMGAAEMVLGLRYSTGRFSALLQGRQTSALDGSYSESGLLGELRFSSQEDGTGLALQLQPSYGGYGEVGSQQASLWNDQQMDALTGWNGDSQPGGTMALKGTMGYGFLLPAGNVLLTPFAEVAFAQGSRQQVGLGLSMEGPSWQVKLSGSREESSSTAPNGMVKLMFSKQL